MKHRNVGEMYKPDDDQWQDIVNRFSKENFEGVLYDFTLRSGVLHGLEVIPAVSPNLTVRIQVGRGVHRDPATRRARVIEVHTVATLNLTTFLPTGVTPNTVKIVASPLLNDTLEAAVTVVNAPSGHPDYDPAFTSYQLKPMERDDAFLEVDSTPSGMQIVLGEVTLTPGQTQITSASISTATRDVGGFTAEILALTTKTNSLEAQVNAATSGISSLVGDVAVLQSQISMLGNTDTALDARIDTLEGIPVEGRFVRVATSPYGNGGNPPWQLYRTRGTDGTGANVSDWNTDKTIGPAGSGADIIWAALNPIPVGCVLALSAASFAYNFSAADLRVGDGALTSLAGLETIIDNPASPTGIRQRVPYFLVKTDAQGRFKVRPGSGAFSTNNFHDYALFLQGYFY